MMDTAAPIYYLYLQGKREIYLKKGEGDKDNQSTRNSNKNRREESQGITIRNNTEVSNINKGICAKGDG
jgi:hypothetical protein